MDLEFWKNIAALWSQRDRQEDYALIRDKAREFGEKLNDQTVVYQDADIFDYDDDDDEDEI